MLRPEPCPPFLGPWGAYPEHTDTQRHRELFQEKRGMGAGEADDRSLPENGVGGSESSGFRFCLGNLLAMWT